MLNFRMQVFLFRSSLIKVTILKMKDTYNIFLFFFVAQSHFSTDHPIQKVSDSLYMIFPCLKEKHSGNGGKGLRIKKTFQV